MDIPNWDFVIESYRHYYLEESGVLLNGAKTVVPIGFQTTTQEYNVGVRAYNARKPRYPQQLMEE